jgi:hypothetical protein
MAVTPPPLPGLASRDCQPPARPRTRRRPVRERLGAARSAVADAGHLATQAQMSSRPPFSTPAAPE